VIMSSCPRLLLFVNMNSDLKPLGNRQVDHSDEVKTLREILGQKCVEMSTQEVDAQLLAQRLQREADNWRSESEGYKLEIERMKQELSNTQDRKYVNFSYCLSVFLTLQHGQSGQLEKELSTLRQSKPKPESIIVSIFLGICHFHPHTLSQIIDSDDESKARKALLSPPLSNSKSFSRHASSTPVSRVDHTSVCNNVPVRHPVQNPASLEENSIQVKVNVEGGEDQFKYVPFVKSEDGSLDIWNLDGLELGPPINVADKYNRGFSRKAISDVIGFEIISQCPADRSH
jgi:hypothetical protein